MSRLLLVILMCVYSECLCASAQSASKAALQRDYGVKLCGREFIRAVIFTCGGSRWKRALDLDQTHSSDNDPLDSPSDRDGEISWSQSARLSTARQPFLISSSSSSLSNLLQSEEAPWGRQGSGSLAMLFPRRQLEGHHFPGPAVNWPSPDRRKRNFSLGLAGTCCNQGCTKNDIGRLC